MGSDERREPDKRSLTPGIDQTVMADYRVATGAVGAIGTPSYRFGITLTTVTSYTITVWSAAPSDA